MAAAARRRDVREGGVAAGAKAAAEPTRAARMAIFMMMAGAVV